jgi:predicted acetyltransferase
MHAEHKDDETLRLIEPQADMEAPYRGYAQEFDDPAEINGNGVGWALQEVDDFAAAVERCNGFARGENLPESWVPASTFWLVNERDELLGTINLRHRLNDWLRAEGGNIGYAVRPSSRRRGYATFMLRCVLDHARGLGLRRVLVTCDRENLASARVIRKCGGVLENEVPSKVHGRAITQRYWIGL